MKKKRQNRTLYWLKTRKAQITMFMLIGIMLVGTFGFVYYLGNYFSERTMQKKVDKIYSDVVQNTPISYYVSNCVDESLDDGVNLIGIGGGVIFSNTEGSVIPKLKSEIGLDDPKNVFYDHQNITLVQKIIAPIVGNEKYSMLPQYPCNYITYQTGSQCRLEENTTPDNSCYFSWKGRISHGTYSVGCVPSNADEFQMDRFDYLGETAFGKKKFFALTNGINTDRKIRPSFKEQLEFYIANRTDKCVNLTGIGILTGQNITKKTPVVNVTISADTVTANVNFPIEITVQGKPPITRIIGFKSSKHVRLGAIRDAIDSATTKDNADLDYNLQTSLEPKLGPNYQVSVIKTNSYDLFIVKDFLFSGTPGTEYIFQFARENRWPVLDYVTDKTTELAYKDKDWEGTAPYSYPNKSIGWDIRVQSGAIIRIQPTAHDPDEDTLTFSYSGWREDYVDFWNVSTQQALANTPGNCTFNPWNCVERNYSAPAPHNWTLSNPTGYSKMDSNFKGGIVEYKTSDEDVGSHVLRVKVTDGEYTDYQDVRILVFDSSQINIVTRNNYGIDNVKASSEDPYYLTVEDNSIFCPGNLFDWQDGYENTDIPTLLTNTPTVTKKVLYSGYDPRVLIMNKYALDQGSYPYLNMSDNTGAFNNYATKDHVLNVTIASTGVCPNAMPKLKQAFVEVYACIPFRANSAPFPYNNLTYSEIGEGVGKYNSYELQVDPFFGNHTCCADDYSFKTSSQDCYHFESYTYFMPDPTKEYYPATEAREDKTTNYPGEIKSNNELIVAPKIYDFNNQPVIWSAPSIYNDKNNQIPDYMNDIYHRVISQSCSGRRGNACTGAITDVWTVTLPCDEKNKNNPNAGEDETCFGPPADCSFGIKADGTFCSQSSTELTACLNYNGLNRESFEKNYLKLSWADGTCNNNWRLSRGGDGGQYDTLTGEYLCQGGCGVGGCTVAINCTKISDYNLKIPKVDYPITGGIIEDVIYGWNDKNPTYSTTTKDYTKVAPPTPPTDKFWCDGKCFSNGGTKKSPTQGTSLPQTNFCTVREYFGDKTGGMQDSIYFNSVNLDDFQAACNACKNDNANGPSQNTLWLTAGSDQVGEPTTLKGTSVCCGDDNNEYVKSFINNNNHAPASYSMQLCCNAQSNCVNTDGRCADSGVCQLLNTFPSFCEAGTWKDPDTNPTYCTSANGCSNLKWWNSGNPPTSKCCGDDLAEDDWNTTLTSGFGCCCDGNQIGVGKDEFCSGTGGGQWCRDGEYCGKEVYSSSNNFASTVTDLKCGCDAYSVSTSNFAKGAKCDSIDSDSTPEGICAQTNGLSFTCDKDSTCVDNSNNIRSDCSLCGKGVACHNGGGVEYNSNGVCTGANDCCSGWASGPITTTIPTNNTLNTCGASESIACTSSTNGFVCDNVADAAFDGHSLDKRCDGSKGSCRICNFETHTEKSGTPPYEGIANSCESGCGASIEADEQFPDMCFEFGGTKGYINSTCGFISVPDKNKDACECIKDIGSWDLNKCCDSSADNWLFTDTKYACVNGVKETCDKANECNVKTVGTTNYYCHNGKWETDAKNGNACVDSSNQNGICAYKKTGVLESECCASGIVEHETAAGKKYYCGCDGFNGNACMNGANSGGFSQNGICVNDVCITGSQSIVKDGGSYFDSCNGHEKSSCMVGPFFNVGIFNANGLCTENNMCCKGLNSYLINSNPAATPKAWYCQPDGCIGREGMGCSPVSDGEFKEGYKCTNEGTCSKCDNTIQNKGKRYDEGLKKFLCEEGCGAEEECDEQEVPYLKIGTKGISESAKFCTADKMCSVCDKAFVQKTVGGLNPYTDQIIGLNNFVCGCDASTIGKPCDVNNDGYLETLPNGKYEGQCELNMECWPQA